MLCPSRGFRCRNLITTALIIVACTTGISQRLSAQQGEEIGKILFFTKSSGYEHAVVQRVGGQPAFAERIMLDMAKQHGISVELSKDGGVFDNSLDSYDAFVFFTSGDLTTPGTDGMPAMSRDGKERLLEAVSAGKGFVGCHSAADTFATPVGTDAPSSRSVDPYIRMLGGQFIGHQQQQAGMMRLVSKPFSGLIYGSAGFALFEEWYSLKRTAGDLHVLLLAETKGMQGELYKRPAYPATWMRNQQQGRVFYTSMGHRKDVWTNPLFQRILMTGILWTMKELDVEISPNLESLRRSQDP